MAEKVSYLMRNPIVGKTWNIRKLAQGEVLCRLPNKWKARTSQAVNNG
jgi:hypothetical protein